MEDVPILSTCPSEGEMKTFQKWISDLGHKVGIEWPCIEPRHCEIADIFWADVQKAFYADIDVPDLIDVFLTPPWEYYHIALTEPRLRKKRRLA